VLPAGNLTVSYLRSNITYNSQRIPRSNKETQEFVRMQQLPPQFKQPDSKRQSFRLSATHCVWYLAGSTAPLSLLLHPPYTLMYTMPYTQLTTHRCTLCSVCVCMYVCVYIIYIYIYIQGVTGGTDQTSGGCSLC